MVESSCGVKNLFALAVPVWRVCAYCARGAAPGGGVEGCFPGAEGGGREKSFRGARGAYRADS